MPHIRRLPLPDEMDTVLVLNPAEGVQVFHQNGTAPPADAISVRFRPFMYDRAHEASFAQRISDAGPAEAWAQRTREVVVSWDLEDDDGVIPLDPALPERLNKVPMEILSEICIGCTKSVAPNLLSSKGSATSSGSPASV